MRSAKAAGSGTTSAWGSRGTPEILTRHCLAFVEDKSSLQSAIHRRPWPGRGSPRSSKPAKQPDRFLLDERRAGNLVSAAVQISRGRGYEKNDLSPAGRAPRLDAVSSGERRHGRHRSRGGLG